MLFSLRIPNRIIINIPPCRYMIKCKVSQLQTPNNELVVRRACSMYVSSTTTVVEAAVCSTLSTVYYLRHSNNIESLSSRIESEFSIVTGRPSRLPARDGCDTVVGEYLFV